MSSEKKEMMKIDKEERHNQKVRGLYKLLIVAILSLAVPLILFISESINWIVLLWLMSSWAITIGVYALNAFNYSRKVGKK